MCFRFSGVIALMNRKVIWHLTCDASLARSHYFRNALLKELPQQNISSYHYFLKTISANLEKMPLIAWSKSTVFKKSNKPIATCLKVTYILLGFNIIVIVAKGRHIYGFWWSKGGSFPRPRPGRPSDLAVVLERERAAYFRSARQVVWE